MSNQFSKPDPVEDIELKPASFPTPCPCGSKGKIAVMRWRLEHGESPFHELDSQECTKPLCHTELRVRQESGLPGIRLIQSRFIFGGKAFA